MTVMTSHDDLVARFAAYDRKIEALQRELAALRRPRATRRARSAARLLPVVLVALLVALVPLGVFAANFTDLNPNSPHNANINAIADAGISVGCGDGRYCPNSAVSREEMASFLARTAGLNGNPPVVNAKTALTVPDSSVTAAKLSPAGSTAGQVLTSTANGVAWKNQSAPHIISGAVNADGTIGAQSTGGFGVQKEAMPGHYTVSVPLGAFNLKTFPLPLVTAGSGATMTPKIISIGTYMYSGSSDIAGITFTVELGADSSFYFILIQG